MNDWAAGTTYTPSSGLGSAFKWGLNGSPQGLSQTGANAFGAGLRGIGQGMMQGGQGAFQNPGMSFAQGLNNGMSVMRQPPPQGAFAPTGEVPAAGGEKRSEFNIGSLLGLRPFSESLKSGGIFGLLGGMGKGGGMEPKFDPKNLFGPFGGYGG